MKAFDWSLASISSSAWLLLLIALAACDKTEQSSNQLAQAASPYLREHADNPVHWYEWTDEALARAKAENKPLLVSIGYASCHWCHVMEEESFMDSTVAKIMNENFVCIKVDREQRPDLDQVYINAAAVTTRNAGWPLNAFALPDGQPFFTITYSPTNQWISILKKIANSWQTERQTVIEAAQSLNDEVTFSNPLFAIDEDVRPFTSASVAEQINLWVPELDMRHGGLKADAKFPLPAVVEMFIQNYYLNDNQISKAYVDTTLNKMARGAIYDHLGGGFARYATDPQWKVPHFEKMLYDNGQLMSLYAHAYQLTGNQSYLDIVNETATFVDRELTAPDGTFYSSLNADSEGEEGRYYKWSAKQIRQALDAKDAELAIRYFGLNANTDTVAGELTAARKPPRKDELSRIKSRLLSAREEREKPTTDTKIIAAWNGMMIIGLIDAFRTTGNNAYLTRAIRCATRLNEAFVKSDSTMVRTGFEDTFGTDGFLEDYAWVARAAVELYQVTFDINWLNLAVKLTDKALVIFDNPHGEFLYFTPEHMHSPVTRSTEIYDTVIPSSNTVMAETIWLLGVLTDREHWISRAQSMTSSALTADPGQGIHLAGWARLAQKIAYDPFEVAITGPNAVEQAKNLQQQYLPHTVFLGGAEENLPLLENKIVDGKTMFYVCRKKVCKLPTEDPKVALKQLQVSK